MSHISHFLCVPTPNVLVERRSGIKHIIHSSHLRCVPTPNVLVERRSGLKHICHMSHFLCVPTPNVLVERRSWIKHIPYSHLRCVPTPNVLVERRSDTNIYLILVTFSVFQLPMSWLNAEAYETYNTYQSLFLCSTSKCRRRMYFYRQSLEKHFHSIHSYLPPNSYPNSASSRSYYQTPTQCTLQYLRPLLQINTLQRNRANSADGIGVRGGGGGGEGGDGGGDGGGGGATQVFLIVSHELAGPVTASVHVNFA